MANQILPLTSDPNQSFQTTLTVDGQNITLQFDVRFNDIAGYWVMKVTDPRINTILIDSVPIILCGNILAQFSYLRIGSAFLTNVSNNPNNTPTDSNLGSDFALIWGDTL